MSPSKEIIYPIFLECCKYTTDIFWENIFEDLAMGKAPYGTYICKNFLCCNQKKKEFTYKIEKKDVYTLYIDIYSLLSEKVGILSAHEKLKKKKICSEYQELVRDNQKKWNDIRKKNIKELLIELFVIKMKKTWSLTLKQTKYLLSIIMLGLILKIISSQDIIYENAEILSIRGITFEEHKINTEYTIEDINISPTIDSVSEKKYIIDEWIKYNKKISS